MNRANGCVMTVPPCQTVPGVYPRVRLRLYPSTPVFLNTGCAGYGHKPAGIEGACAVQSHFRLRVRSERSSYACAHGRGHPARPFPPRNAPRRVKPQGGRISHHVGSETTVSAWLAPCGQVVAWVGHRQPHIGGRRG